MLAVIWENIPITSIGHGSAAKEKNNEAQTMQQVYKTKNIKFILGLATVWLVLISSSGAAQAATVTYTLDNVLQDNAKLMTGSFNWTYTEGDFENGTGLFTELYIPGHGTDIDALTINFDIANSIEFSFTDNVHNGGVNVSLFLQTPLTPTQSALVDLNLSSYEIEVGAQNGGFVSGSILASAVPIPATVWLFGSGLLGLIRVARRKKA